MNASAFGWIVAAFAVSAATPGCSLLTPTDPPAKKHVLIEMPSDLPRHKAHAAKLLVLRPDADPIYDTTQMAYATQQYEIGYFRQNEWGERPALMLHPLLVKTMEDTGYFSAVLTAPYSARYSFVLESKLLELTQDFTSDPPAVRLVMRFELDDASHRLIATKEVSLREPMLQGTPYAGVAAANGAVAKLLRQAARFVLGEMR